MLGKKLEFSNNNDDSLGSSINPEKQLTLVKSEQEKNYASLIEYYLVNSGCNLNFWGAGPMDEDFIF
ncbi:hypothetical protein [Natronincola ferrireducens]|uniref:Uncharacterized protein n=1 Tax=Natronincola ferrireducens TaxID=393762 RepID=A0A1G9F496_9FIRM|nr:hypothetical protein [Natronincola ferrireducens]SDK83187.1 hypothetical protein SAMN05660472_02080 [Natronincola ferrireducens]